MKADKNIAAYRRMRNQPLWRLLASGNGPTVIGLLQSHLFEKERSLPASILFERLTRDLEELRAQGDDFPQTAQAYVSNTKRPSEVIRIYGLTRRISMLPKHCRC